MFANRRIPPNAVLAEYRGRLRSVAYRGDKTYCAYSSRWFRGEVGWEKGCYIDASTNRCLARYTNHCYKTEVGNNAMLREIYADGRLYLISSRTIHTDVEVLIDYGKEYWDESQPAPIRGGAPN